MSDVVLKQERLDPSAPKGFSRELVVMVMITFGMEEGCLYFKYLPSGSDSKPVPHGEQLDLHVRGDTEFYVELDPSLQWHWSDTLDAITTKKDKKQWYGELQYERNGRYEDREDGEPGWKCKRIRFLAKLNKTVPGDDEHGFSLNIDLVLPDGSVLPITLDPDIKNPPQTLSVSDQPRFLSAA